MIISAQRVRRLVTRPVKALGGVKLLPWLPRLVALAVALPSLVVLYYIFWARLSYPLDLEWMESGVLVTAKRAMDQAPLYASPTLDFASFCYPPLYPVVLGWLGRIFGLSYTLGRALSVLAFTAILSLMAHAAWRAAREAAPRLCGRGAPWYRRPTLDGAAFAAVSMASVAVAYGWTGAWYDLVRIDMVFLALSVGAFYALAAGHRSVRGVILAGVLLGLAYLTKQTAVFFIVAAGLAQLLLRARLLPVLVVTVGVVAGLTTLAYNRVTDGWFWFYIFDLHQSHQMDSSFVWSKAPRHLWTHGRWLYLGCGAAVIWWSFAAVVRRRLAPHAPLWLLGALAGVAASTVGRSTQWAFDNAYIPGVVLPAIFCAVAAAEAWGMLVANDPEATGWRGRVLARPRLLWACAWLPAALVGIGVLSAGVPETRRWVPDAQQRSEARRFLVQLKRMGREGEVFVPYHPYYNVLAGGRGHGHIMNVNDVAWTRREVSGGLMGDASNRRAKVLAARRSLLGSIRATLRSDRFVAVIHDRNVVHRWTRQGQRAVLRPRGAYLAQLPGLTTYFRPELDLAWLRAAPRTLSGNPSAPRFVWRRLRPARPRPLAGSRVVFDFETGGLAGWTFEGTAFGRGAVDGPLWDPRRRGAQGLVGGAGGRRWVSSFHGGDAATGKLTSPSFRLDRPVLRFRLGGGRDLARLFVGLRVDGQMVRRATARNSEQFRSVTWDVRSWLGRDAKLEIVDASTGSWGHLQVDEVWLGSR